MISHQLLNKLKGVQASSGSALNDYIKERLETLHTKLEKAEPEEVRFYQGQIKELRNLGHNLLTAKTFK